MFSIFYLVTTRKYLKKFFIVFHLSIKMVRYIVQLYTVSKNKIKYEIQKKCNKIQKKSNEWIHSSEKSHWTINAIFFIEIHTSIDISMDRGGLTGGLDISTIYLFIISKMIKKMLFDMSKLFKSHPILCPSSQYCTIYMQIR